MNFIESYSIGISDTSFQSYKKKALKNYYTVFCCFYINLKIECEIIAI